MESPVEIIDRPKKIHLTAFWDDRVFQEEVNTFYESLVLAGYQVSYVPYKLEANALNIVFGAISLSLNDFPPNCQNVIIRNLEHVFPEGHCMFPRYIEVLKRFPVWDYAADNIERLAEAGVPVADHVPVCHASVLENITPAPVQDIDVYFYGNVSERRAAVIEAIRARGLNVVVSQLGGGESFGAERNALIARSKVVLNIGLKPDSRRIFEVVRVGFLLANGKAVVGEVNEHTVIEDDIRAAVVCGTLEELPALCEDLVRNAGYRRTVEARGREIFRARNGKAIIGAALERYYSNAVMPRPMPMPRQMCLQANLLGGWRYDFINVNSDKATRADLHFKIDDELPWGNPIHSWRLGEVSLKPGMVDFILAEHVFECVDDLVAALSNCLKLLTEGGALELLVPYDLGFNAWRDIRTQRSFNERSFVFSVQQCIEFGWRESYFENQSTVYCFAERGGQLVAVHNERPELLSTETRCFESMRIRLVKKAMDWNLPGANFSHTAYYSL